MIGKKNCGCGEGLCKWVGTPCECEYKGRLSIGELHKVYDNVDFVFSEWFGDSKGLSLTVNEDVKVNFTKLELESFINILQKAKSEIYVADKGRV